MVVYIVSILGDMLEIYTCTLYYLIAVLHVVE